MKTWRMGRETLAVFTTLGKNEGIGVSIGGKIEGLLLC